MELQERVNDEGGVVYLVGFSGEAGMAGGVRGVFQIVGAFLASWSAAVGGRRWPYEGAPACQRQRE